MLNGSCARVVDTIKTPSDFLKAIGRNEQDKFKVGEDVTWEQFFSYKGVDLKIAEVSIRDRRCVGLRCAGSSTQQIHFWQIYSVGDATIPSRAAARVLPLRAQD